MLLSLALSAALAAPADTCEDVAPGRLTATPTVDPGLTRTRTADGGLDVTWAPTGADAVTVVVQAERPDRVVVCTVADDGALQLGAVWLKGVGRDASLTVWRADGAVVPARRHPAVADQQLRVRLTRAEVLAGGGTLLTSGAALAHSLPVFDATSAWPGQGEALFVAPWVVASAPLSLSAAVDLVRTHDRLNALGVTTDRRPLQAAQGLVLGGLGLEVLGAGLALGLEDEAEETGDTTGAVAGYALMVVGTAASVTGNSMLVAHASDLRRVSAGLSFGPDGNVNGAVTVDFQ